MNWTSSFDDKSGYPTELKPIWYCLLCFYNPLFQLWGIHWGPYYNCLGHGVDVRMREQDHCSFKPAGHCQMVYTFHSLISPLSPSSQTETLISWGHGRRPSVTGSLAVWTENVKQMTKEMALDVFPDRVNAGVWKTHGAAACKSNKIRRNASLWQID